jgi:hypothetical protein
MFSLRIAIIIIISQNMLQKQKHTFQPTDEQMVGNTYCLTYILSYIHTVLHTYCVTYILSYIYPLHKKMYSIKSGQNSHPTFRYAVTWCTAGKCCYEYVLFWLEFSAVKDHLHIRTGLVFCNDCVCVCVCLWPHSNYCMFQQEATVHLMFRQVT